MTHPLLEAIEELRAKIVYTSEMLAITQRALLFAIDRLEEEDRQTVRAILGEFVIRPPAEIR